MPHMCSLGCADKARDFGAGPLFNQILPLLMSPTLEDQERHLLVKVRGGCCVHCVWPLVDWLAVWSDRDSHAMTVNEPDGEGS